MEKYSKLIVDGLMKKKKERNEMQISQLRMT